MSQMVLHTMGGWRERLVVRDYLWKLVEKVVDAGR